MLAAVYHGPDDVRVEQIRKPEIGPDEVLLKVVCASICGTDLRIWHGNHRLYPAGTVRVPGHEVVGDIIEIGGRVRGLMQGQRVFVAPNMGCGHCRQCVSGNNNRCANYAAFGVTMDGAFAEYMRLPATAIQQGNLIPVQPGVDSAMAALIEPFACVLRGQNALKIRPVDIVLVMGAGPIGIMHMLLARLQGARRVLVSELADDRLAQAARLGADRVIDISRENLEAVVNEESQGEGIDVVIVAAPAHDAQENALRLAGIGGRINFFGGLPKDRPTIAFDSNQAHYKELIVTATTACSTLDCWQAAEIVNSGKIDLSGLISLRLPLRETVQALAAAENRKALKVALQP